MHAWTSYDIRHHCNTVCVDAAVDVSDDAWTAAFRDNSKWQGLYDYDGQSIKFTLAVHSASDSVVKATLQDRISQMELIGRRVKLLLAIVLSLALQQDHIVVLSPRSLGLYKD